MQGTSLDALRAGFGQFLRACGVVAGAITFGMMMLVVANVGSRYFFNLPIPGTLEITESALGYIIFLSLAMTQYESGHIRVVLLTRRLPAGLAQAAEVLALAAGAAFFAWATWAGFEAALQSWAIDEQEWGAIQFPLWPVRFAIALGLALMSMQCVLDTLSALAHPEGHPAP